MLAALVLSGGGCAPFDRGDRVGRPSETMPIQHGVVDDDALADQIDGAVEGFYDDAQVPGMAVAIAGGGRVLFSSGYGWADLETERLLDAQTPVLLSSVSKTFIGVAAMQAIDDGRLELDDPIAEHVGFAVDNPNVDGEIITVRHALTHNTGIEDSAEYDDSYEEGDPATSLEDFLQGYVTEDGEYWRSGNFSDRAPGEEYAYSNVGSALGALAIGEASDLPFHQLVSHEIFDPLGMVDSAYLLADLERAPAVPYDPTLTGDDFRAWPQYGFPTYPDGLLRSSATDMARYLAAIEGDGQLDGVSILQPGAVDRMLTVDPNAGTDEDGQAIIWAQRRTGGRELFGHDGSDLGSTTELWIDRDARVGVAVLVNSELGDDDVDAMLALVLRLLELAGPS